MDKFLEYSFKEAGNSFQHFWNEYTLTDEYDHCLSSDTTILASRKCPAISEPIWSSL